MKEDPASAAEYLDVPLIIDREQSNDEFPQRLLAAISGLNRSLEQFDTAQTRLPLDGGDAP